MNERRYSAPSGIPALIGIIVLLIADGAWFVYSIQNQSVWAIIVAILTAIVLLICLGGFFTVAPNEGKVLQFFGRYVGTVRDKILTRIIKEWRFEVGLSVQSKPTATELELAWVFHGGIFYYGVRKFIYESPVLEDKEKMIADAIDTFLIGMTRALGKTSRAASRSLDRLEAAADR